MLPFLQKLHTHLLRSCAEFRNQSLLLCVSGGSDSIALLHTLHQLQGLWGWSFHVLHFHHHLRPEADDEAAFVAAQATALDLPFHLFHHHDLHGSSLQAKARAWRRDTALAVREQLGGGWIVTAHHADDQVETLLLKLLRGVHLSGIRGMSWMEEPFARPLLGCSKQELQQFLIQQQLTWKEDASNAKPDYLRNRVRNELIPLLEELTRHGLTERLQALEAQSERLQEWLEAEEQPLPEAPVLTWAPLKHQARLIQETHLHRFLKQHLPRVPDYRGIQEIREQLETRNAFRQSLPLGWEAEWDGSALRLRQVSRP